MLPALYLDGNYPYDVYEVTKHIWEIDTLSELDDLLEELDRLDKVGVEVAIDTETNDIDPKAESPAGKGVIITTQFSWIEEAAWMSLEELVAAIDAKSVEPTRVWVDCRNPSMLIRMKAYMEGKAAKVMQGSSFDAHEFWNHGIKVRGVVGDTLQMSRNQYPERMSHSLDGGQGLVVTLLGETRIDTRKALGVGINKKDGSRGMKSEFRSMREYVEDVDMRPFQQVYSTYDVYDTIRIFYILKKLMMEMEWENHEDGFWGHWIEWARPYLPVLLYMERQGVCVDAEVVESIHVDYKRMQDSLEVEIYEIIQCPANLNSAPQVAFVLFGEGDKIIQGKRKGEEFKLTGMGLPCKEIIAERTDPWVKKPKWSGGMTSGNPSCDKDHLEWTQIEIDDPECDSYRLLSLLKQRNELETLIVNTLKPLKRNMRPRHQTGVRTPKEGVWYVHGNFSPATRTGRLASSLPNLQNIPTRTRLGKKIRHAFIAEEGMAMLVCDYSQLELNILGWYLAFLFNDLSYAQLLRDGDIHQSTADSLGIKRSAAKAVNFGILYGMTEFKLALQLRITLGQARNILMRYYEEYPAVEQYGQWAIEFAEENGTARSMFGRYRQLPNINEVWTRGKSRGRPTSKAKAEGRRAKNTPIQASAQDIVGAGQILIHEDEELRDYHYKMQLQVHDEVVGVCDAKYADQALKRKIHLMETAVEFPEYDGVVKFPVDGNKGLTWADAKEGHLFDCPECEGDDDCKLCEGEGGFNVRRAGDIWVAEAA